MRTRWGWVTVVVGVLAGCADRLTVVEHQLSVTPERVDFRPTAIGSASQQLITLSNTARGALEVRFAVDGPFSSTEALTLQGGETRDISITFSPVALGLVERTLTVSAGDMQYSVVLFGEGAAPPACVSANPCVELEIDLATLTCAERPRPDGTSCSTACLTAGQCVAGVCVGSAVSCDDGNACTVDSCEAASGCVHDERICAPPTNPCLVPRCDSVLGCATSPAADGTACGSADCNNAHVCIGGSCQLRPVPEGAACGEHSPCRPAGRCESHVCVQGPAVPLEEAWHVDVQGELAWSGVTDPFGNLYWLDCIRSTCEVVSHAATGAQRFRVPFTRPGTELPFAQLWSNGRYVVAFGTAMFSFDAQTGAIAFTHTAGQTYFSSLAANSAGRLIVSTRVVEPSGIATYGLSTLDGQTGARLSFHSLSGAPQNVVLNRADDVYVGLFNGVSQRLLAITNADVLRYDTDVSFYDPPIAAAFGTLVTWNGSTRAAADGHLLTMRPSYPLYHPAVVGADRRYLLRNDAVPPGHFASDMRQGVPVQDIRGWLDAFVPGLSNPIFSRQVGTQLDVGDPLLLADGAVMIQTRDLGSSVAFLRAIDLLNRDVFVCELPGAGAVSPPSYAGSAALTQQRWVVAQVEPVCSLCPTPAVRRVTAFKVPGVALAAQGWVTAGGSAQRAGAPR